MKLTPEQMDASRCEENLMLTACPGSGKTRVIISKLSRVVEEVRDTPRSVACITYTNTAVQEIERRLRHHIQPGDDAYYDICTIHSFCLNHIFRPFGHILGYKDGFKVLTQDSEDFQKITERVYAKHSRPPPSFGELDEFVNLRVSIDGEPIIAPGAGMTVEMAKDYWRRLREGGFVDFANILYFSYRLLNERSEILDYISAKFAWILVDEFQDTTDIQVEMLSLIADAGRTKFLLVGDPFQSIYGFAGARPDLAAVFAARINARTDMTLSGNFRCSTPIVDQANLLFARTPPMQAVGPTRSIKTAPVWRASRTVFTVITDEFLPAIEALGIPVGEAAILAPWWTTLFPLGRRLREYGVAVVGPGARPYRRARVFAPLAEEVCGYLMEPNPESLAGIERSLFLTILDATGRAHFDIYSYEGRIVLFELLRIARDLQEECMGAIDWLERAAPAFSDVLVDAQYFTPGERDIFSMAVEDMKSDIRRNMRSEDPANLTIEDLGVYASPEAALKLSSLHHAKGREFRAVAMIDMTEGRIPHFSSRLQSEFDEAKRLFYVGVTRAEEFLFYVTDNSDSRNGPTRFLRKSTGVGMV
ncbi:MAG: ATP-dependent helicase [Hyphomonadaceae bacterium]